MFRPVIHNTLPPLRLLLLTAACVTARASSHHFILSLLFGSKQHHNCSSYHHSNNVKAAKMTRHEQQQVSAVCSVQEAATVCSWMSISKCSCVLLFCLCYDCSALHTAGWSSKTAGT